MIVSESINRKVKRLPSPDRNRPRIKGFVKAVRLILVVHVLLLAVMIWVPVFHPELLMNWRISPIGLLTRQWIDTDMPGAAPVKRVPQMATP